MLFVMRHAMRDATHPDQISPQGREQSENLVKVVGSMNPLPQKLITSPKLRTQQTLTPLSQDLQLPLEIVEAVDERAGDESQENWVQRIDQFIDQLDAKTHTVICSHYDWVERFLLQLPNDLLDIHPFSPGQWIRFDFHQSVWVVTKTGQI